MGDPCAGGSSARTAGEAMVLLPKTCPPSTTAAQARALFADDHVHALLVVDGARLLAVVEREDLLGRTTPDALTPDVPAHELGRLYGRTVPPGAPTDVLVTRLRAEGRRRLAVVDEGGHLLGLLCFKRSGRGFCSDADIAARSRERALIAAGC
ncbi:CBS domain-containing protein [Klenkia marina]|uniref:CBS domain-containing protein n=1 Tax=Klenkia marina TaxID=1960309 RepID=A0A1G4XCH7_9ACTN|nr:CBS domain-containing protein [Klenkia marina]SCX38896.1 CBS domain-containing protein [Klenkia marina]